MPTRFANLGIHSLMKQARQPRIVHVGYGRVERVLATHQTWHTDVTPTQRCKGFGTKGTTLRLVIGFEQGRPGDIYGWRTHLDKRRQVDIA